MLIDLISDARQAFLAAENGQYVEHAHSRALPRLAAAEVMGLIAGGRGRPYSEWLDEVERWAREDLAYRPA